MCSRGHQSRARHSGSSSASRRAITGAGEGRNGASPAQPPPTVAAADDGGGAALACDDDGGGGPGRGASRRKGGNRRRRGAAGSSGGGERGCGTAAGSRFPVGRGAGEGCSGGRRGGVAAGEAATAAEAAEGAGGECAGGGAGGREGSTGSGGSRSRTWTAQVQRRRQYRRPSGGRRSGGAGRGRGGRGGSGRKAGADPCRREGEEMKLRSIDPGSGISARIRRPGVLGLGCGELEAARIACCVGVGGMQILLCLPCPAGKGSTIGARPAAACA